MLYSKQLMYWTKSLCILKGSLEVILSSQCVSRDLFPAKNPLFFGWYDVLWAVCAVARRCSWPIHPSSARSLSAARSSNLLFVWKPSIIFLSMTHWPTGIPSTALQECFSWYEVMCLCCAIKLPNKKQTGYCSQDKFTWLRLSGSSLELLERSFVSLLSDATSCTDQSTHGHKQTRRRPKQEWIWTSNMTHTSGNMEQQETSVPNFRRQQPDTKWSAEAI